MTAAARHWEQDRDSTVYIGNLDERVTDALVFELFLQSGRIANVHLPKDRVTQTHQGYGFVEFICEEDADYSARVMNGVRLFGKPIRVNKASADKTKAVEVGAELFVGNLDPLVDERILFETFGRFGTLVAQPKVARDEANLSKGYGFVSYADFSASDDAIANMNGQYLMNKEISVQYAYKKDGKGERHGDQAERMLAAQARQHGVQPTPATIPVPGGPLFPTQPPTGPSAAAGVLPPGGVVPAAATGGAGATPTAGSVVHPTSRHAQSQQPHMMPNGFNNSIPPTNLHAGINQHQHQHQHQHQPQHQHQHQPQHQHQHQHQPQHQHQHQHQPQHQHQHQHQHQPQHQHQHQHQHQYQHQHQHNNNNHLHHNHHHTHHTYTNHTYHRPTSSTPGALASVAIPPPPPLTTGGLPARPPPSQAGYGGPQGFVPGFGPVPQVPVPTLPTTTAAAAATAHQLPAGFAGAGAAAAVPPPPPSAATIPPQPQQHQMPFAPPPGFGGPQTGIAPPPPPASSSSSSSSLAQPSTTASASGLPPGFQGFGVRK